MLKKIYCVKLSILLVLLFFSPAISLMLALNTSELTKNSDIVVRGKVEKVNSFWSMDKKIIISWATLNVMEVIRGKFSPKSLVVEYVGGEVGGIGFKVSDVSAIQAGEEVVLFLIAGKSQKDGSDIHIIYGNDQGKYRIDGDGMAHRWGVAVLKGNKIEETNDNSIKIENLVTKIRNAQ